MALDTTIGGATADSYATIADADAYFASYGGAWSGDDASKEAALRRATLAIDGEYGARWSGSPVNGRSQSLDWPRTGAMDINGYDIAEDAIPVEVVRATCEIAQKELSTPGSFTPDISNPTIKKQTVGKLSVEYNTSVSASASLDARAGLTRVESLLSGLIATGSLAQTGRLLRA